MLTQAHWLRKTASSTTSRSADLNCAGHQFKLVAEAISYYALGLKRRVLADQQRRREAFIVSFQPCFASPLSSSLTFFTSLTPWQRRNLGRNFRHGRSYCFECCCDNVKCVQSMPLCSVLLCLVLLRCAMGHRAGHPCRRDLIGTALSGPAPLVCLISP